MTTTTTQGSLIGGRSVTGTAGTVRGVDPRTNQAIGDEFSLLGPAQVEEATELAHEAFATYRSTDPETRGAFLESIAERLESVGAQVVETAQRETGLPEGRLSGELARTANQLRLFATVARAGDYLGARIEPALPDRKPLPRPDLRQVKLPLGPVAVFGASNFPLAFSVAGGDTASALAAGCPVVFKAHNAHPATSRIVGQVIADAVASAGLPPGTFSLIYGSGSTVGQRLAADPRIKAVGFTGSRSAGVSLMETAAARPVPIPVYAEMSSINPVYVLPSAIRENAGALAQGFVGSLNGSAGQLCTAPGLLWVPEGPEGDRLIDLVIEELTRTCGLPMLTEGICRSRINGEHHIVDVEGVELIARGQEGDTENAPAPAVYRTTAENFRHRPELSAEVFGAFCLIIRYASEDDLLQAVGATEGQLTATLHVDPEDVQDIRFAQDLVTAVQFTAGRVLFNAWPTGVDVGDAMVHGGPFPATSDGRSTSVGTLAIDRFLRPVVFQSTPETLLPQSLLDSNPWHLVRRVNGEYVLPATQ
ncbi:aldehyde dehydrogenase (NADP(+)) [Curtobacterium sp. S6]|uniref:aldehyde dehydrogenase (NADP(+)) n=1 Tax=Curtobacterium sp. S6 TaxID=1479623 RepID=UPI0004AA704E|nr:aldehyde dehydrogenase (NADP(+)) [Curtobacterium sp. S6]